MEDCELENRVKCFVAWLVDEDLFVGNGSDDVVVDEVIDESMGPPSSISATATRAAS